ncbi:uncharacterized protein LOC119991461 [Tripterygium wilfordii]|uniref:uncharacterized protein LOC119991461 n=1 Tax=Tripterygium wilfordii TaxID=458696 RepID=UPI0018F8396D|nr:uncharacterized protein LOC119991461 [Tripterygium wilfordii]
MANGEPIFYEDDDFFYGEDLDEEEEVHTPMMIEVDTTEHFQNEKVFQDKETVIDFARRYGCTHGIVVIVKRSDLNDPNRTPRILFGYERSGGYRGTAAVKKRKTSTKKCGCPFFLKAHVVDVLTGSWKLVVVNGKHNHTLVRTFEGHSYVGRLNKEEKDTVERLSKTGVRTRDILNHIKLKDPTNASNMKTMYNVKTALRIHETAGKSHMQQLFKLLTEHGYVTMHRFETTTKIVGVTSTKKTFSVALCYMCVEKEENYIWALGCFRDLCDGVLASIFICDREIALMNALKNVFSDAKNLLYRVHISKNVLSNCVGMFRLKYDLDDFMACWSNVMRASTENEYEEVVRKMQTEFKDHPRVLSYVNNSWLFKYKTYFVAAWVDKFFHLGNTTTNRVESSHSKLNKYLSNSVGGFVQSFNKIDLLLQGQVVDIKASFEESLTRVPIRFKTYLYKELVNMVSIAASDKIEYELASVGEHCISAGICNHNTVTAFVLPCADMLSQYRSEGRSIPLTDVHNYWKKLCIQPFSEDPKDEVTIETKIEIIRRLFANANLPQKLEMKRQLQTLGKPSNTSLLEPKPKVNVRGRKKGQRG